MEAVLTLSVFATRGHLIFERNFIATCLKNDPWCHFLRGKIVLIPQDHVILWLGAMTSKRLYTKPEKPRLVSLYMLAFVWLKQTKAFNQGALLDLDLDVFLWFQFLCKANIQLRAHGYY